MNARMYSQEQLANDWAPGKECVAVNDRVWFEDRDGCEECAIKSVKLIKAQ